MAALAESDEIFRRIIGPVAIAVMDVQVLLSTTDPASLFVPVEYLFPECFPFLQAVFVTDSDHQ